MQGLAPNVTIMPLKVLNARGEGSTATVAEAITYAVDEGADIINMSLGSEQDSDDLREAMEYAQSKGVITVCAAGNSSAYAVNYPARYSQCIATGSYSHDTQKRAAHSNYGAELDILADGENVGSQRVAFSTVLRVDK